MFHWKRSILFSGLNLNLSCWKIQSLVKIFKYFCHQNEGGKYYFSFCSLRNCHWPREPRTLSVETMNCFFVFACTRKTWKTHGSPENRFRRTCNFLACLSMNDWHTYIFFFTNKGWPVYSRSCCEPNVCRGQYEIPLSSLYPFVNVPGATECSNTLLVSYLGRTRPDRDDVWRLEWTRRRFVNLDRQRG